MRKRAKQLLGQGIDRAKAPGWGGRKGARPPGGTRCHKEAVWLWGWLPTALLQGGWSSQNTGHADEGSRGTVPGSLNLGSAWQGPPGRGPASITPPPPAPATAQMEDERDGEGLLAAGLPREGTHRDDGELQEEAGELHGGQHIGEQDDPGPP